MKSDVEIMADELYGLIKTNEERTGLAVLQAVFDKNGWTPKGKINNAKAFPDAFIGKWKDEEKMEQIFKELFGMKTNEA